MSVLKWITKLRMKKVYWVYIMYNPERGKRENLIALLENLKTYSAFSSKFYCLVVDYYSNF